MGLMIAWDDTHPGVMEEKGQGGGPPVRRINTKSTQSMQLLIF